jgi:hypothetical protein
MLRLIRIRLKLREQLGMVALGSLPREKAHQLDKPWVRLALHTRFLLAFRTWGE